MLGFGHVTCVDIDRIAKLSLVSNAANYLASRLGVTPPRIPSWNALYDFGITYLAPQDLRTMVIEPDSVDCFFSVDTLEHVPALDLSGILKRARYFLRPSGRSIHLIDYSDHYARADNLSRFNFLDHEISLQNTGLRGSLVGALA